MVSMNLAVLNLLPIPILDGGHLFFLLIEKLKGSLIDLLDQAGRCLQRANPPPA